MTIAAEAEAGTSRQRLLLEGSRAYRLGDDATLTATLEVGLRNDAGDAETGSGLEEGRGLSVRVGSAWGAAAGGAERIWGQRFGGFSPGAFDPEASLTEPANGEDTGSGVLLKGSRRW